MQYVRVLYFAEQGVKNQVLYSCNEIKKVWENMNPIIKPTVWFSNALLGTSNMQWFYEQFSLIKSHNN